MNKIIISGNWKMNKTKQEAIEFIEELKKAPESNKEIQIYVPNVYLDTLNELTKNTNITIGAQNIHQKEEGAYTGEISVPMLKSLAIKNVLIGHSERRQYFNENDEIINEKILLCLANEIKPTLCIGETLDEKNAGITKTVLDTQIKEALKNVTKEDLKNIIIAYEPVWAIGTGVVATSEQAGKTISYIRQKLTEMYDENTAANIVIQYGGSVKPDNIQEILNQKDINGALVGGASLDVNSYINLLK